MSRSRVHSRLQARVICTTSAAYSSEQCSHARSNISNHREMKVRAQTDYRLAVGRGRRWFTQRQRQQQQQPCVGLAASHSRRRPAEMRRRSAVGGHGVNRRLPTFDSDIAKFRQFGLKGNAAAALSQCQLHASFVLHGGPKTGPQTRDHNSVKS